jgi:hypothetical protein
MQWWNQGCLISLHWYTKICKVLPDVNYTIVLKSITFTEQEDTKVILSPVQLYIASREDKRCVKVREESPPTRIGGAHHVKLLRTYQDDTQAVFNDINPNTYNRIIFSLILLQVLGEM